ncbi:DNA-processing protein DprA [Luteococcus peritonei]|uniref:DNA-processing protein DprA n=1 Tax=Luteococcus peritonei TaxID=88874 RepID=A0ABW4RX41_9ACTN
MSWDEERLARAGLSASCEAGAPRLAALVAAEGAQAVWQALRRGPEESTWARRARLVDLDRLVERSESLGVAFLVPGDEQWPEQLNALEGAQVGGMGGPPVGLWARGPGRLSAGCTSGLAVVGARSSTPYGESVAADLAAGLARGAGRKPGAGHRWTIFSGGAYGIDACAHRAALSAGGTTVAVLAGGLDEPYPRGNHSLFERLAAEQLLVSEVPVGLRPTRAGFLARNRLIAALTQGTVLVEAGARSGAINTASWAAECGRHVMAVPGPVHSAMSEGCHRLVRDGRASLVSCVDDVQVLVQPLGQAPLADIGGPSRELDGVEPGLLAVREVLPGRGAMPVGEVAARAGLAIPATLASLGALEQLGLAGCDEAGQWRILRPRPARTDVPARRTGTA